MAARMMCGLTLVCVMGALMACGKSIEEQCADLAKSIVSCHSAASGSSGELAGLLGPSLEDQLKSSCISKANAKSQCADLLPKANGCFAGKTCPQDANSITSCLSSYSASAQDCGISADNLATGF